MKWVRPVLVTILTLGILSGFFTGKISTETFCAFATGLIVWWFKSRDDKNKPPNSEIK